MIFFLLLLAAPLFSYEPTLSERATNPLTNLSQLQTESDFSPKNYGTNGSANSLTIKPLMAISKSERFPVEQLIRVKFQIPTLPRSSTTYKETNLGDTQIFDLFTFEQEWGRWGIGPMAIFPTAATKQAGQGQWQFGPAFGFSILRFHDWQLGCLAQNPLSCKGKRPAQNTLLLQPFIIYHFWKNTYAITNGEWTFDWINQTHQIPLNIGLGHTFILPEIKIDTSLQLEWMASQNGLKESGYVNQFTIQFCLNFLFPD